MWGRTFWLSALERLLGAVLVSIATAAADAGNVLDVDWPSALGIAGAIALGSLAASVAKAPIGDPGTPSLVPTGRHTRDG